LDYRRSIAGLTPQAGLLQLPKIIIGYFRQKVKFLEKNFFDKN